MKQIVSIYLSAAAAFLALALCPAATPAQTPWVPKAVPVVKSVPASPHLPVFVPVGGDTSEKALSVAANVNLSLCVMHGDLKVNGWDRNEVRIFVKDGSRFGFKVLEKERPDGKPVWIMATSLDHKKPEKINECLWGEEIEIDVPAGATVKVKAQGSTTTIDTVNKVKVENVSGDISLRNITGGIGASTYEGDVTVENAKGPIDLESTTGNIVVYGVSPGDFGDTFKARTNSGTISLEQLDHRQIEIGSISGTIAFNGTIRPGGLYTLSTSNGSIRMMLPADSSGRIAATYGSGIFTSELPIKLLTENIQPGPVKSAVWSLGAGGDATIKLTTGNGRISIRKR